MKLESVRIKNFRSIESIELNKCNGFNVLIGKNNSGKSNILLAINAFFTCIQGGNLANLHPPIGKDIDYFGNKNSRIDGILSPIDITMRFSLTSEEVSSLKGAITKETPQMKTAVDGIDVSMLIATVKINYSGNPFSFISRLALVHGNQEINSPEYENVLLSIGDDAANEIQNNLSRLYQLDSNIKSAKKVLKELSADEWRRFSAHESDSPGYIRYVMRELLEGSSKKINEEILSIIRDSNSYEIFKKNVENLATSMEEENLALRGKKLVNKINTFAGAEEAIPKYISDLLLTISKIRVHNLTERRKRIGQEEAARLLELKVRRGGSAVLRNIQETISALLGVNIDAFQGSVSTRQPVNSAELDVDDFLVQVNGSGIREALRIVLDVEFLHPNILLVEEPEVHLHPSLETNMMHYLKRKTKECQIFITTHSTNFLDTAEMKNIYLVSKTGSTQVEILNLDEAESKIPKELGIRLSSLFMYDKLVFVEGPSDEAILRELASKLELNLGQNNAGFIRMGGVRNFAYYATEETLSFLTKRRVKMWFLVDKDEKDKDYFERLERQLNGKANFKVLSKRELENYLVCPRALKEFIKLKHELSGKSCTIPDETKIKEDINECANQLRQFAINKRLFLYLFAPIYPHCDIDFENIDESEIKEKVSDDIAGMIKLLEDEKNKVDEIYREQNEFVDSNWENNKMSLVPGDILIDKICQKYDSKFNKIKDGERLASLMEKEEIDQEIKAFLIEVCDT